MKNHPMIKSLLSFRGNTRACVYTEPLWGIPNTLYTPFASVYMAALMVTDKQIGIIASVILFSRAVSSIFSGAITDKFGRRFATFFWDLICWSLPCILWAISQNFWYFMIAAAFNGLWQITDNSWQCLLVEDSPKNQMVNIFSWVYVSAQLAVFFTPFAGLLVKNLTLIPAVRIIYVFSFVFMTAKFIILYIFSTETEIGKKRMHETKNQSIWEILYGYKSLLPRIFASSEMRLTLAITVLFQITRLVMDNFFGLYATKNLGIATEYLAYFPIIRSSIMLLFLFAIQSKLTRFGFKGPMLVGVLFYIASHLLLVFVPAENLAVLIAYTSLESIAYGLVIPRKDSIAALFVDPQERARIVSIMTVIVLAICIPFGYIAGLLSEIDRRLPFVLNLLIFGAAFVVISASKLLSKQHMEEMAKKV